MKRPASTGPLAPLCMLLASLSAFDAYSSALPFEETEAGSRLAVSARAGAGSPSSVDDAVDDRIHLWRSTRITYAFDAQVPELTRVLFRTGANVWNSNTSWQLVETSTPAKSDVIVRPHASRCAADTGAPREGAQSRVYLSTQCTQRSMVHEIGHIIGMQHEHQRLDRNARITLRTDTLAYIKQNYPDSTYQNVVQNLQPIESNPGQPYAFDEGSIMMYGSFPQREPLRSDLLARNLPLFTRKDGTVIEASPARLSNKDIAQAELLATIATTLYISSFKY